MRRIPEVDPDFRPCPVRNSDELFPNGTFVFDISRMLEHLQSGSLGIEPTEIDVGQLPPVFSTVDESTLATADLTRPLVLAEIAPGRYNLIDGHFHSYGIGFDLNPILVGGPSGEIHDVLLNRIDPADSRTRDDIADWYSDGVGPVQYTITTPPENWFKLWWWKPSTPTQGSTWGRIKSLFR